MLECMSKSKHRSNPRAGQAKPDGRPAPAEPLGQAQQASRMSPSEVLKRIKYARIAQQEAEAQLAALVDQAVGLGIGWPEIAAQLGVSRQAARQHYQRRHSDGR
jgi:predicted transcriptional regulator